MGISNALHDIPVMKAVNHRCIWGQFTVLIPTPISTMPKYIIKMI